MINLNEDWVKKEYQKQFGEINESLGFSITTKRTNNGVLITVWYERNSWVDPEKEREVLFSEGVVYEKGKKIGTF